MFSRTTTCSVPYSSKLAPVSRVLILTWTYQRKVPHEQPKMCSIWGVAQCWHVNVFLLQCFPTLPAAGVWTERTGNRCPTCRLLPEGLSCPLSHPGPSHQVPSVLLLLCWEHKLTLVVSFFIVNHQPAASVGPTGRIDDMTHMSLWDVVSNLLRTLNWKCK